MAKTIKKEKTKKYKYLLLHEHRFGISNYQFQSSIKPELLVGSYYGEDQEISEELAKVIENLGIDFELEREEESIIIETIDKKIKDIG